MKQILSNLIIAILLSSCATTLPQHFAERYYKKNEKTIVRMEALYNKIYKTKPIVAEFSDNAFNYVMIEMKTDSLRYVYEFNIREKKLQEKCH